MSVKIGITNPLYIVRGAYSNIDAKYGPYNTTTEALAAIPIELRREGLTVGIIVGKTITEYWFQGGIEDDKLVVKVGTGSLITKLSQLTNDVGYITSSALSSYVTTTIYTSGINSLQTQIDLKADKTYVDTLASSSNKGYQGTLAELQSLFPNPLDGWTAYTKNPLSSTGYYISTSSNGVWTESTIEAPAQVSVDLTPYQKITDNNLATVSKNIVGAINEVNAKIGSGGNIIIDGSVTSLAGTNEFIVRVGSAFKAITVNNAVATESVSGLLNSTDKIFINQLKTMFELDSTNNAIKALKKLYSVGEISAYGLGESGGGGSTSYILPVATPTILGGIKVGSGLTITTDGVLSTTGTGGTTYIHPTYTERALGLYKIIVDNLGHISGATAVAKSDITALGIPSQDTTYNIATTSTNGLMSAADKSKLDGIQAGAQVNTVTSVAGKTGAVTLTKSDVGLSNVDNTADSAKNVLSASKLTTTRTIWGQPFNGTGNVDGNLTANGNITATGEVTAYVASDIRLKRDIFPIFNSLEIISKLYPVSYKWNDLAKELNSTKTDALEYGLIAQDVENVIPDIVHTIYDGQYKAIDYIKLIPFLIDAIKELKAKLNF